MTDFKSNYEKATDIVRAIEETEKPNIIKGYEDNYFCGYFRSAYTGLLAENMALKEQNEKYKQLILNTQAELSRLSDKWGKQ